ncbi:MAG: hypothetical protein RSH78_04410 [Bacilli bacterium]
MNQDKINMINTYIENNVGPVLIEGVTSLSFPRAVVLPSNCEIDFLNGHYEDIEFVPPIWYTELMNKQNSVHNLLVIDNITNISIEEQLKFCEILKYRKISTFGLPENCAIIITCDIVDKTKISPEIYALVAHI